MNQSSPARQRASYALGISFVAALGGFLFGFDMTVISGAVPYLERVFSLGGASLGWAVGCCILACAVGAAVAGKAADRFGRRSVLRATAVVFAISSIGTGWVDIFPLFVFFRMLGGLAIGAASGVAPIYIAESTPARLRGRCVSFYQLAIVVGISASYYSNYFLAGTGPDAWRWMFTACAVPAVVFLLLLSLVPETPRWLAMAGRRKESLAVLTRIDGADFAESEFGQIQRTLIGTKGRLADLMSPKVRRIVIIGATLGVFSQISGANAVFLYAPKIFAQAGADLRDQLFQTSLVGLINLLCTFIPIAFVERAGRRPILLTGAVGMAVTMIVLTISLWLHAHGAVILVAVLAFIAAYCGSIACLTWVILSEIFPNRVRGEAMAVANLSLWTANFVLLQTFPMIEDRFGISSAFAAYSGVCLLLIAFVWRFIPETKGRSLEEIENHLVGMRPGK